MRVAHTQTIAADVEHVWDLTLDIERWPQLTPTMTEVTRLDPGRLQVGSRARIAQPKQRPRVWTVTRLEQGRCFEWSARIGTVTMTAGHLLESTDHGCRNTLIVELSGLGSRLLGLIAGRALRTAIETENDGFRRAAETAGPEHSTLRPGRSG